MAHEHSLKLPLAIIGPGDLNRLKRELLALDDYLNQAQLRRPGAAPKKLPKTTTGLDDLASVNNLNLLQGDDRAKAIDFIQELSTKAPIVHISFASDPSAVFMSKITAWFRDNINPRLLVSVGLEPSIAAGCTIRTDNHLQDFSLRKHFDAQRGFLLEKIKET